MTGESSRDNVHLSAPIFAREGCKVIPDRTFFKPALLHTANKDFDAIDFPLNHTEGSVIISEGEFKAEFEATHSGT